MILLRPNSGDCDPGGNLLSLLWWAWEHLIGGG